MYFTNLEFIFFVELACVVVVLGLVMILEIMFNTNQVFTAAKK